MGLGGTFDPWNILIRIITYCVGNLYLCIRNRFLCVFQGALISKMLLVKCSGREKHANSCLYNLCAREGNFANTSGGWESEALMVVKVTTTVPDVVWGVLHGLSTAIIIIPKHGHCSSLEHSCKWRHRKVKLLSLCSCKVMWHVNLEAGTQNGILERGQRQVLVKSSSQTCLGAPLWSDLNGQGLWTWRNICFYWVVFHEVLCGICTYLLSWQEAR